MMPALVAAWQFVRSPIGRYLAMAAAGALLIAAGLLWHAGQERAYGEALRQTWLIEQRAAVADAVAQARKEGDQAAQDAAKAAAEAARAEAPVREVIRRVPVQSACVKNPAVRASLDELQHPLGSAGGSATSPTD